MKPFLLPTQGRDGRGCAHLEECARDFGCPREGLWDPARGLIPRSFAGALGFPHEVRLVIVLAEPSKPEGRGGVVYEPFDPIGTSEERLEKAAWYSYTKLEQATPITREDIAEKRHAQAQWTTPRRRRILPYHRNLRRLLDLCWDRAPFDEIMRRSWLTASMLCPIPSCTKADKGRAVESVARRCASAYLVPGLSQLPSFEVVVGMGRDAQKRLEALRVEHIPAWHPGGSAANATPLKMLENHEAVARAVRRRLGGV